MSSTHDSSAAHAWGDSLDPETQRIHFAWLVWLRWGAIVGQAAAIAIVHYALAMPLPLPALGAVLCASALYNLACGAWVKRARAVREPVVASAMAIDVLSLTALLYFTGGPSNPFSFLYLVHIALAAVALRSWWTWSLVALSLACFAALFLDHQMLEPMAGSAAHAHMDHSGHMAHMGQMAGAHDGGMNLHLQGMWVAFGIAAAFIVYAVNRVTRDLAAREAELVRVRAAAIRNEKLAALATLAAGAAHELATPLSTIAIAAKELEQNVERAKDGTRSEALAEDVKLIRAEVARCRGILQQMSIEAGQSAGEGAVPTSPEVIVKLALDGLQSSARVERITDAASGSQTLVLPEQAVALALRGLLKNALEASSEAVKLRVSSSSKLHRERCVIEVRDTGPGMAPDMLARIGEPFFTTKPPGQGMGLGVFVARALCEQIGGELEVESVVGKGTAVRMSLPVELSKQGAREPRRVWESA